MSSESASARASSQKTTNTLLGANIVVLAAGFVRLGAVGPWPIQVLSEAILSLVLVTAVVLVIGHLHHHE